MTTATALESLDESWHDDDKEHNRNLSTHGSHSSNLIVAAAATATTTTTVTPSNTNTTTAALEAAPAEQQAAASSAGAGAATTTTVPPLLCTFCAHPRIRRTLQSSRHREVRRMLRERAAAAVAAADEGADAASSLSGGGGGGADVRSAAAESSRASRVKEFSTRLCTDTSGLYRTASLHRRQRRDWARRVPSPGRGRRWQRQQERGDGSASARGGDDPPTVLDALHELQVDGGGAGAASTASSVPQLHESVCGCRIAEAVTAQVSDALTKERRRRLLARATEGELERLVVARNRTLGTLAEASQSASLDATFAGVTAEARTEAAHTARYWLQYKQLQAGGRRAQGETAAVVTMAATTGATEEDTSGPATTQQRSGGTGPRGREVLAPLPAPPALSPPPPGGGGGGRGGLVTRKEEWATTDRFPVNPSVRAGARYGGALPPDQGGDETVAGTAAAAAAAAVAVPTPTVSGVGGSQPEVSDVVRRMVAEVVAPAPRGGGVGGGGSSGRHPRVMEASRPAHKKLDPIRCQVDAICVYAQKAQGALHTGQMHPFLPGRAVRRYSDVPSVVAAAAASVHSLRLHPRLQEAALLRHEPRQSSSGGAEEGCETRSVRSRSSLGVPSSTARDITQFYGRRPLQQKQQQQRPPSSGLRQQLQLQELQYEARQEEGERVGEESAGACSPCGGGGGGGSESGAPTPLDEMLSWCVVGVRDEGGGGDAPKLLALEELQRIVRAGVET